MICNHRSASDTHVGCVGASVWQSCGKPARLSCVHWCYRGSPACLRGRRGGRAWWSPSAAAVLTRWRGSTTTTATPARWPFPVLLGSHPAKLHIHQARPWSNGAALASNTKSAFRCWAPGRCRSAGTAASWHAAPAAPPPTTHPAWASACRCAFRSSCEQAQLLYPHTSTPHTEINIAVYHTAGLLTQ
jgi:hypothetical protein